MALLDQNIGKVVVFDTMRAELNLPNPFISLEKSAIVADHDISKNLDIAGRLRFSCHHRVHHAASYLIFALVPNDMRQKMLEKNLMYINQFYMDMMGDHMEKYVRTVASFKQLLVDDFDEYDDYKDRQEALLDDIYRNKYKIPTKEDEQTYERDVAGTYRSRISRAGSEGNSLGSPVDEVGKTLRPSKRPRQSVTANDEDIVEENLRSILAIVSQTAANLNEAVDTLQDIARDVGTQTSEMKNQEKRIAELENKTSFIVCQNGVTLSALVSMYLPIDDEEELAYLFKEREDLTNMIRHFVLTTITPNISTWTTQVFNLCLSDRYMSSHFFNTSDNHTKSTIRHNENGDPVDTPHVDAHFRQWFYALVAESAIPKHPNYNEIQFFDNARKKFDKRLDKTNRRVATKSVLDLRTQGLPTHAKSTR